jgi:hypothetical protein
LCLPKSESIFLNGRRGKTRKTVGDGTAECPSFAGKKDASCGLCPQREREKERERERERESRLGSR